MLSSSACVQRIWVLHGDGIRTDLQRRFPHCKPVLVGDVIGNGVPRAETVPASGCHLANEVPGFPRNVLRRAGSQRETEREVADQANPVADELTSLLDIHAFRLDWMDGVEADAGE